MKFLVERSFRTALALLLIAAPLSAQTGTLTGRVTNAETAGPVPGASVQVQTATGEILAGSITNPEGTYRVAQIAPGAYTVVINVLGFQSRRFEDVRILAGETTNLSTQLIPAAVELNPLVVSASRRQERALDAPARVEVVSTQAIEERPAVTPVDHLRAVPGVDIATHGVQSANIVTRGFSNIFSGALFMLTDHRIAGVPSLRVNLMHFIPSNNEDMERMEVVLGPGAALYGPNTANGVLHVFTRSPLTHDGTVISLAGGQQEVFNGSFRTAHRLTEDFGFKVSGEYLRAQEWEYHDPVEVRAREEALLVDPNTRIGARDFQIERWAGEARADWRIMPDLTSVFSVGRSHSIDGIELTGIGGGQVRDWAYTYYQARATFGRLFGQVYLNTSDAGDTYLLRTGEQIVDRSQLLVAQVQHGTGLIAGRQRFTYGADMLHTRPNTGGTIHGRYEDDDDVREIGAYLQSETALTPMLDLVLAARIDDHDRLEDPVFSPRAALVFKPAENQAIRASFNRAFSTPRSLDLFLDLDAGPFPDERLAQFGPLPGYGLRAQGGGGTGFTFRRADGGYLMRSPFHPFAAQPGSAAQAIPANVPTMWDIAVGTLHAQGAFGPPTSPLAIGTAAALRATAPTDENIIRVAFDVLRNQGVPLQMAEQAGFIDDVPVLRPSYTTSFEVGYKGILGNQLLIAADVWTSRRNNFISALRPVTPLLFLEQQTTQAFLESRGFPTAQAAAIAAGIAQVPVGVVTAENASTAGNRADFLVTYRNFGQIDLHGADISATYLVTPRITLGASASFVSDTYFETEGELITLNAPDRKLTASIGYRNPTGLTGELRLRHNASFPVLSAPYVATGCIPDQDLPATWQRSPLEEPCVENFTLADVMLGYRVPQLRGTSIQLMVQNLFDTGYRSFPGVPEIGRMAMLRLRYEF